MPPHIFVEKLKEIKPQILAMSAVLSVAINSMMKTVTAVKEAGLNNVKILIGGSPVDGNTNKLIGADEFTNSASEGVIICKQWIKELNAGVHSETRI